MNQNMNANTYWYMTFDNALLWKSIKWWSCLDLVSWWVMCIKFRSHHTIGMKFEFFMYSSKYGKPAECAPELWNYNWLLLLSSLHNGKTAKKLWYWAEAFLSLIATTLMNWAFNLHYFGNFMVSTKANFFVLTCNSSFTVA